MPETPDFDHPEPSDRDLAIAAMDALWPLPRVIPGPYVITQSEIDTANRRVATLLAWTESTTMSSRQHRAYRELLEWCSKDNALAQVSLDTNERQRFNDKWTADRKADAERVRRANMPKPPSSV